MFNPVVLQMQGLKLGLSKIYIELIKIDQIRDMYQAKGISLT